MRPCSSAPETGKVVASAPLSHALVDGAHTPLILLVFPLNRQTAAQNAGLRATGVQPAGAPADLEGYALGVLQLDRVVENVPGRACACRCRHRLWQTRPRPRSIPQACRAVPVRGPWVWRAGIGDAEFHHVQPFTVAGMPFYLAMRSDRGGNLLTRLSVPAEAALLALALTALLTQSMFATTMRKRQVERAVIARTAELSETNRALSAEIEQRRQVEAALRIAKDKAEAANRAKSAFLSTMSHELRTPLNAVIGFSSMLIDQPGASPERMQDYLGEINGSGTRLLDLINDILEITQMDTETHKTDEMVYLPDIAGAVIEKVRPQAERAGVTLHNDVGDALPALRGDSRRLQKGAGEPALQRRQIHAGRRRGAPVGRRRTRRPDDRSQRQWHGHDARRGRQGGRSVLAGRQFIVAPPCRCRPGPDLCAPRRGPSRCQPADFQHAGRRHPHPHDHSRQTASSRRGRWHEQCFGFRQCVSPASVFAVIALAACVRTPKPEPVQVVATAPEPIPAAAPATAACAEARTKSADPGTPRSGGAARAQPAGLRGGRA